MEIIQVKFPRPHHQHYTHQETTNNRNPQFSVHQMMLCVLAVPKIPLIQDLLADQLPAGFSLLVEFDPDSQWFSASITIAAGWLKTGGEVSYSAFAQPPDRIRSQLNGLGLNCEELERQEKLSFLDWYTMTLGEKSKEKFAPPSLKVADLSIWMSREVMRQPPSPDTLRIVDDTLALVRFNDEKAVVEFVLTRYIPSAARRNVTTITGVIRGVHSDAVYKQLEAANDGIIDFKLEEEGGKTRDLMRIRNMRNVHFDREWHELKLEQNFEVTLHKR